MCVEVRGSVWKCVCVREAKYKANASLRADIFLGAQKYATLFALSNFELAVSVLAIYLHFAGKCE